MTDATPPSLNVEIPTSRRRVPRRAIFFAAVVIPIGVVIPIALRNGGLPRRFAIVAPGILYRSAQPTTRQIDNVITRHGIKTILIVRSGKSERVPDETTFAQSRGVKVVQIPIDSRKPITDDQVEAFFQCVDNKANRPVLIHCSAGRHRTGYLCALYRIEREGWSKKKAIDEMMSFGFNAEEQTVVLKQIMDYTPKTIWMRPQTMPGEHADKAP